MFKWSPKSPSTLRSVKYPSHCLPFTLIRYPSTSMIFPPRLLEVVPKRSPCPVILPLQPSIYRDLAKPLVKSIQWLLTFSNLVLSLTSLHISLMYLTLWPHQLHSCSKNWPTLSSYLLWYIQIHAPRFNFNSSALWNNKLSHLFP